MRATGQGAAPMAAPTAAPMDTAPGDTAPGDTAPGDTAPGDTAPGDTAPGTAPMVHGVGIGFSYADGGGGADGASAAGADLPPALDNVHIEIQPGEFVAILGKNGSGKSTLAKHFNALLPLQQGTLHVAGIDVGAAEAAEQAAHLRRLCGMVFQNPDNQFVSSLVEEDVAFGLENHEVPREAIAPRVQAALRRVGMEAFAQRAPQTLSGGQKQRVALAGILAVEPEVVVFDEATAMLDTQSRAEVLAAVHSLHAEKRKTIVLITHHIEEAVAADRVCLLHEGHLVACGPPREVLSNAALLHSVGLLPPLPVRLYADLKAAGICLATCPLTPEALVEAIEEATCHLH